MEQLAICIWNFKGGTGKTTISMVISQMAAQKGLNVITADLDPSHNLKRALALSSEMFPTLQMIDEVPKVNDFLGANLFVLDTHPDMSDLVKAALSFADLALIPVLGDFFSALNMGPVWRFIKDTGMSLGQAAIVKNAYENTVKLRMRATASPTAAPRPWPMCSGPVGLALTNSTCTFRPPPRSVDP